jgi:ATP-dependent DNA helicase RecG
MIAAMQVLENNWQVAMLAPTEILAKQHFQKISKFFSPFNFKIALLTASESKISQEGIFAKISKKLLQEKISGGAPLMVIGTHAILQKNIQFGKLALVIVDEQHRFGIAQRASLLKKDSNQLIPHLLSMSATPIPRTLALGLYGDLDISILDELPQGRKKIITKVVLPKERNRVYEFVREEIKGGRQVFVICPRIDPSKHKIEKENDFFQESEDPKVEIKAVKSEFKKLSKDIFPEAKVSMLHGKMKPYEKELIMRSFLDRKIDILVSTSVVEVGIDVPNATIIIIEGAEHFGLSQIHQFRGRVGRGEYQSYCFLFVESYSKNVRERLNAIVESENGFELAQKDLQIRGPGQFFGNRQWGLPDLAMQALSNIELVQIAREEAIYFLKRDPNLNTAPMLKHRIEELRKKIHIE